MISIFKYNYLSKILVNVFCRRYVLHLFCKYSFNLFYIIVYIILLTVLDLDTGLCNIFHLLRTTVR